MKRLVIYKLYQQKKKRDHAKATEKWIKQLKKVGYTKLRDYYQVRRAIRNDKLLWQAHTTKDQFFSVGILVGSGMQQYQEEEMNVRVGLNKNFKVWEN